MLDLDDLQVRWLLNEPMVSLAEELQLFDAHNNSVQQDKDMTILFYEAMREANRILGYKSRTRRSKRRLKGRHSRPLPSRAMHLHRATKPTISIAAS